MSHTLLPTGPLPPDVTDTLESTCTVHRHREADDGATALLERVADECIGVITETIGSVDAGVLDALGESGYLIDVARGTLTDERGADEQGQTRPGTIADEAIVPASSPPGPSTERPTEQSEGETA